VPHRSPSPGPRCLHPPSNQPKPKIQQNADDNAYAPGVAPALEFVLHADRIEVLNNERGFTEAHLRALCDVGRSTKAAATGFIGQKGIGFKACFRVTDAPQVHSGGFAVAFDVAAHRALGYVLPTWLEGGGEGGGGEGGGEGGGALLRGAAAATRIVLPLKPALLADGGRALRLRFDDVRPTLLLFLQRLRAIAVTDASDPSRSNVMARRRLSPHLLELRHGPRRARARARACAPFVGGSRQRPRHAWRALSRRSPLTLPPPLNTPPSLSAARTSRARPPGRSTPAAGSPSPAACGRRCRAWESRWRRRPSRWPSAWRGPSRRTSRRAATCATGRGCVRQWPCRAPD